jgi:hypothetical protein
MTTPKQQAHTQRHPNTTTIATPTAATPQKHPKTTSGPIEEEEADGEDGDQDEGEDGEGETTTTGRPEQQKQE